MSEYQIAKPIIGEVIITPNPAIINKEFVLKVIVTEQTFILEPEIFYSGELYSDEV